MHTAQVSRVSAIFFIRTSGHGLIVWAQKQSSTARCSCPTAAYKLLERMILLTSLAHVKWAIGIFAYYFSSNRKPKPTKPSTLQITHGKYVCRIYVRSLPPLLSVDSLTSFVCRGLKKCTERSTRWTDKKKTGETNAFEKRRQRHTAQTQCVTHVFKMNNETNECKYYMQKANRLSSRCWQS